MNTIKKAIPASYILADSGYAPTGTTKTRFVTPSHLDKLLMAAAASKIGLSGSVHRNGFFSYVQCYIDSVFVEPLQRTIQGSWALRPCNRGRYGLTREGYNYICNNPDVFRDTAPVHATDYYVLHRPMGLQSFAVVVDPVTRCRRVYIDEEGPCCAEATKQYLWELGAQLQSPSSRSGEGILNWIVQDRNYYWQRFTKMN